jgi:hypothetical protein
MPNENENSYTCHQFSISKPLGDEEKDAMLKKIHSSLKNTFDIMGMCNELCPGDSEEDRIKRVFMFTSKICGFTVDWLEEHGAAVVLDKNQAQAILTELMIPMPSLIEGFGTDVLKKM